MLPCLTYFLRHFTVTTTADATLMMMRRGTPTPTPIQTGVRSATSPTHLWNIVKGEKKQMHSTKWHCDRKEIAKVIFFCQTPNPRLDKLSKSVLVFVLSSITWAIGVILNPWPRFWYQWEMLVLTFSAFWIIFGWLSIPWKTGRCGRGLKMYNHRSHIRREQVSHTLDHCRWSKMATEIHATNEWHSLRKVTVRLVETRVSPYLTSHLRTTLLVTVSGRARINPSCRQPSSCFSVRVTVKSTSFRVNVKIGFTLTAATVSFSANRSTADCW